MLMPIPADILYNATKAVELQEGQVTGFRKIIQAHKITR